MYINIKFLSLSYYIYRYFLISNIFDVFEVNNNIIETLENIHYLFFYHSWRKATANRTRAWMAHNVSTLTMIITATAATVTKEKIVQSWETIAELEHVKV